MRLTAATTAIVFGLAAAYPAPVQAGECYVDSDCPTGMVCNSAGGCVVPTGNSGGSSNAGHRSGAVVLLYAVILGAVVLAILIPSMQATKDAGGVRARLDDLDLRHAAHDPAPQTCNLTLRF